MKKKRKFLVSSIFILLVLVIGWLYTRSGFLQSGSIDIKDAATWSYVDGIILEAKDITFQGSSGECWILVHGYTSTPDEMRELAAAINKEFNDTVYAPRLLGHGMLPSNILQYSIRGWYEQIANLAQSQGCKYLVGSSMNGNMVLRYAEEYSPKSIVVLAGAFKEQPSYLPSKKIIKLLYYLGGYLKKKKIGTIDDPEGLAKHISTWSFPLKAVVEMDYELNPAIKNDIGYIKARVLFINAAQDTVVVVEETKKIYDQIIAEKEWVKLPGNHLILRDYGSEKAIREILQWRAQDLNISG